MTEDNTQQPTKETFSLLPDYDIYQFCMEFNKFSRDAYRENQAKGFWDDWLDIHTNIPDQKTKKAAKNSFITTKLALIMTEVAEAIEGYRANNAPSDKLEGVTSLEEELADTVIRIADLCGGLGIDLGQTIWDKLNYNRNRSYKHGKQF